VSLPFEGLFPGRIADGPTYVGGIVKRFCISDKGKQSLNDEAGLVGPASSIR
jgi:hypothetical protein